MAPSACTRAQAPAADADPASLPAGQLQQLVAQEQAALDAGDGPGILESGRQLGLLGLRLVGNLYVSTGRCPKAAEVYRETLKLDLSEAAQPRVETGISLLKAELCAHDEGAADRTAEEIAASMGNTAEAHLLLGKAYLAADDGARTIRELSRAVAIDPKLDAVHLALGAAYWELNEYQYNQESLREFKAAQHADPTSYFANENLGAVLSQYERYKEASAFLHLAAAADPSSPDPWLQLGMNAFAQEDWQDARTGLERAIALTGKDEARNGYQVRRAYAAMSRVEAQAGDQARAAQFERREAALHLAMNRSEASLPLSESVGTNSAPGPDPAISQSNHSPRAAQQATPASIELERRLNSIIAKSLNDAGTVLARQHDYAAALPLFRAAAMADPELEPVMRNLGLAAFHAEAYVDAIPALTKALAQHPEDQLVQGDLARSRAALAQSSQ